MSVDRSLDPVSGNTTTIIKSSLPLGVRADRDRDIYNIYYIYMYTHVHIRHYDIILISYFTSTINENWLDVVPAV